MGDKAPPAEDAAGDGAEKAADAPPEEEVPEGGDTPPEEEVPEGGDTPAEKGAPEGGDKPEEVVEGAADGAKSEMGPAEDKIDEAITVMNKLNDLFEKIVNSLNDAAGDGESGGDVEEENVGLDAREGGEPPAEGGAGGGPPTEPPADGGADMAPKEGEAPGDGGAEAGSTPAEDGVTTPTADAAPAAKAVKGEPDSDAVKGEPDSDTVKEAPDSDTVKEAPNSEAVKGESNSDIESDNAEISNAKESSNNQKENGKEDESPMESQKNEE